MEGQTIAQIAESHGVNPSTVSRTVARAEKILYHTICAHAFVGECISQDGVDLLRLATRANLLTLRQREMLYFLLTDGVSIREISEIVHRNRSTVCRTNAAVLRGFAGVCLDMEEAVPRKIARSDWPGGSEAEIAAMLGLPKGFYYRFVCRDERVGPYTRYEYEILARRGMTVREAAADLGISPGTVKRYWQRYPDADLSKLHKPVPVLWQWMALLLQIGVIFTVTGILGDLVSWGIAGETDNFFENVLAALPGNVSAASSGFFQNAAGLPVRVGFLLVALIGRFFCDKMAAEASCRASVDVKRILRGKIYEKMLALGASYKEKIATSEVVQMSGEGVEQLEIYFGKYLPQLFYSLLAPVTLFLVLSRVSLKAGVILLICVPLIPLSIVAVQKIAGRLFRRYWGYYSNLGDVFLENLQGLTTLKIYQADAMKAEEMDEASDQFRKITMKVLTMQLNSTSVMDVVAYGGAAVGMAVSISEYFAGSITMMQALCITLLASEFFIPLRLLGSFFHIAMNGMAASDKIFAFLDMEEPADGTEEFPVAGR